MEKSHAKLQVCLCLEGASEESDLSFGFEKSRCNRKYVVGIRAGAGRLERVRSPSTGRLIVERSDGRFPPPLMQVLESAQNEDEFERAGDGAADAEKSREHQPDQALHLRDRVLDVKQRGREVRAGRGKKREREGESRW